MRIISIESNFRRPGGHRVNINPAMGVIALIGANGTGKTSTANAISLACFKEAISDAGGGNVKAAGLIADEGLPPGEKELVASVGWASVSMPSVFRLTAGKTNSIKAEGITWPEPPHAVVTDILRRSEGVMVRDLAAFVLRGVEPESMYWLDMPAPLKTILDRAKSPSVAVWFKQALDTINERIKAAQAEARVLEARAAQGLVEVLGSDIEAAQSTIKDYEATFDTARAWTEYDAAVATNSAVTSRVAELEAELAALSVPTGADEKRVAMLRAATGVARYYLTSKTTPRQCPCCGAAAPTITEAHVKSVEAATEKIASADVEAARKREQVKRLTDTLANARRTLRPVVEPEVERVDVDEVCVANYADAERHLEELQEAKRKWDDEQARAARHATIVAEIATLTAWRDTLVNRQREMVDDRLDGFVALARSYMPSAKALGGRTLLVDLKGSRPFIGLTDADGNRYKPCGGEWQAIVVAFAMAAFAKVGSPIILPDINWGAPLLMACVEAWAAYPGNVIVQVAAAPAALDVACNTLRFGSDGPGNGPDPRDEGVEPPVVADEDAIEVEVEVEVARASEVDVAEFDVGEDPVEAVEGTYDTDTDTDTDDDTDTDPRYAPELFAPRGLVYRMDARAKKKQWSTFSEDGAACLNHLHDRCTVLVADAEGETWAMTVQVQLTKVLMFNNSKDRARAEIAVRPRIGADGRFQYEINTVAAELGWKIVACEVMTDRERHERLAREAAQRGIANHITWRGVRLPEDAPYWFNSIIAEHGLKSHPSVYGLK